MTTVMLPVFLIVLSRACPTESVARSCVYAGEVLTSEEVTPNKEYHIARLILAVVYFLVDASFANVDMFVAL